MPLLPSLLPLAVAVIAALRAQPSHAQTFSSTSVATGVSVTTQDEFHGDLLATPEDEVPAMMFGRRSGVDPDPVGGIQLRRTLTSLQVVDLNIPDDNGVARVAMAFADGLVFGYVDSIGNIQVFRCATPACAVRGQTSNIGIVDGTEVPSQFQLVVDKDETHVFYLIMGRSGSNIVIRVGSITIDFVNCGTSEGLCSPNPGIDTKVLNLGSQSRGADLFMQTNGLPGYVFGDVSSGFSQITVRTYTDINLSTFVDRLIESVPGASFIVGRQVKIDVAPDGNPVVAFGKADGGGGINEVNFIQCTSSDCLNFVSPVLLHTDHILLDLDASLGFPYISMERTFDQFPVLMLCVTAECDEQLDVADIPSTTIFSKFNVPIAVMTSPQEAYVSLVQDSATAGAVDFVLYEDDSACPACPPLGLNAICLDTPSGSQCVCDYGFNLDTSGNCFTLFCEFLDCDQNCDDTGGSAKCDCDFGFELEADQRTCRPTTCAAFPPFADTDFPQFNFTGCPLGNSTEANTCNVTCVNATFAVPVTLTCDVGGTWTFPPEVPFCVRYEPNVLATSGGSYVGTSMEFNRDDVEFQVSGGAPADTMVIDELGVLQGTLVSPGNRTLFVFAEDEDFGFRITIDFDITVAPPLLTNASQIFAFVGQQFTQGVLPTVTGGRPPYTFGVKSGDLPPGMSVEAQLGILTGNPLSTGNFRDVVISATDQNNAEVVLEPFDILVRLALSVTATAPTPPVFQEGIQAQHDFGFVVTNAEGGVSYLSDGDLPDGVALRSTGELVGIPFAGTGDLVNDYLFDVLARDETGEIVTVLSDVSLTVHPPGDCEDSGNGPNAQGCGTGQCLDETPFDSAFTCDCTGSGLIGDNCNQVDPAIAGAQGAGGGAAGTDLTLVGGIIGGMGSLLVIVMGLTLYYRHKRIQEANKPFDFEAEMERMKEEGLVQVAAPDNSGEHIVPREIPRKKVTLLDKLGAGQFGDVFKGTVDESDVTGVPEYLAAVKTLHDDPSGEEKMELMMEACMMAQFKHKHVVNLIGVCTKGMPYLMIVQYCENGALSEHLKGLPQLPKLQHMMKMAYEIAVGMAYLSDKGLIHRDLAARNVLLDSQLMCKVADFGLSKDLDDTDKEYYRSNKRGMIPVRWTAIEALEDRRFSQASDVWSWGITVFEILTKACMPYNTMNNQICWMKVKAGYRLPCPESCTEELYDSVIKPCWNVECSSRPTFVQLAEMLNGRYKFHGTGAGAGKPAAPEKEAAASADNKKAENLMPEDHHGYVDFDHVGDVPTTAKAAAAAPSVEKASAPEAAKGKPINRHGTKANPYVEPEGEAGDTGPMYEEPVEPERPAPPTEFSYEVPRQAGDSMAESRPLYEEATRSLCDESVSADSTQPLYNMASAEAAQTNQPAVYDTASDSAAPATETTAAGYLTVLAAERERAASAASAASAAAAAATAADGHYI